MTAPHPRLSISALCSWTWSFEQDLEMWSDLGVHHVGLAAWKLDAFGHDAAVSALRERNIKASCVVAGGFDLRQPDTWDEARQGLLRCMETAVALEAPCIYTTTGRTTGALWYEVLDTFARVHDEGTLRFDIWFRDSHMSAERDETVLHEYTTHGSGDRDGRTLRDISSEARVLPWRECIGAVESRTWLAGRSIAGLRQSIRAEFTGTHTCTHLNDTLRSLEDLPALARALHTR